MKAVWWNLVAVLMTASLVACGGGGASTPCMTDAECPSGSGCVGGMCAEGESGRESRDASGEGDAEASGEDAVADTAEEPDASPEPDVSEDDSGSADTDPSADAVEEVTPDAPTDTRPPGPSTVSVAITAPEDNATFEEGYVFFLEGEVSDTEFEASELEVAWTSTLDGELFRGAPEADGTTRFRATGLSPGQHRIELSARNPVGGVSNELIDVGICTIGVPETFDIDVEGGAWRTYGDAYFDPGGWLELTGLGTGARGAIFNVEDVVNPGNVRISFRIYTGGGAGSGADGFAMSVMNARDVSELEQWIGDFSTGGCMAYGLTGGCGGYSVEEVESFHIEFDTWYNTPGDGSGVLDPTENDHVAITLNGDPATHVLWADLGDFEDSRWHDVVLDIQGARVMVTFDGALVIDEVVEGLAFKGGYIGFTGSTGLYTNWHRFDDLQILEECLIE